MIDCILLYTCTSTEFYFFNWLPFFMNSGVTSRVASSVGIIGKRFWMGGTNEEPIWMWGTTKSRDEVFGLHGRGQKWWATFFQKIGGKKWHWRMLWLIFKVFSEISWCVEKILHHARRTLSPPPTGISSANS